MIATFPLYCLVFFSLSTCGHFLMAWEMFCSSRRSDSVVLMRDCLMFLLFGIGSLGCVAAAAFHL